MYNYDGKEVALKWEVKHKNDFNKELDFLETVLLEDGIKKENIQLFLHPNKKSLIDPFLMKNMDKAVNLVHSVLNKKDGRIFVKPDPDVDGFSSASVLIQFLKFINPNVKIEYKLTYDKSHGLTFKNLAEYTRDYFDLIIIPDASMTCKEAIQIRDNFNAEILVLDHHLITEEYFNNEINEWIEKKEAEELNFKNIKIDNYTNYCIAVNCHDDIYPNPDLSGVGVVQKFIEAYLNKYEEKESLEGELKEYFYDLVSLGMISDNISVKNPETRFYMVEGIKKYNQRNELINEIQIRNEEEFKFGRTIKNSGWVLGPRINAVIRYGKKEELDKLFKAILDVNETVEYQPRRKSKNDPIPDKETHTLQWDAARICDNVKARQDTEVRKFMKEIEQKIKDEDLLKNSVLFVDGTKVLTKDTVSGLVANKLASKYLRPVVLMREKSSTEYGGSARGYDKGPIKELNTFLSEAGVTAMGQIGPYTPFRFRQAG